MTSFGAAVAIAAAVWMLVPSARDLRARGLAAGRSGRASDQNWHRLARAAFRRLRLGWGPAARRRAAAHRARTIQALGALSSELQSGRPALAALASAGGSPSAWPVTAAAARLGEDVAAALLVDARDAAVLAQLAACWRVSTATGTGFSAAVARLAQSARTAEDVRVNLEGQLAGPRATARMLALLPLVGIGFGVMLGSDPLSWLLTTPPGLGCLIAGAALTVLGTVWTGRIAAGVERLL